jgi:hypothetical protein
VSSTPPTDPFVPPPPPTGSSLYPPDVLARQAAYAASEAKTALVLSVIGVFCFGFIFGLIAFKKANTALETINIYGVAEDKRSMAVTAKVISIIVIVLWGIGLILRIFVLRS